MRIPKKWCRWLMWSFIFLLLLLLWRGIQQLFQTDDNNITRGDNSIVDHWGIDNNDINWLPGLVQRRSEEIPVVVVEEHYEVLKYWFQAADLDLIPKSRNTLVHIDGHVDGALPYDTEVLPWFRYPRSRMDVYNMMQRNDMFITAAAITGLISHVIWVWPQWDSKDHDPGEDHLVIDLKMGYTRVKMDTGMTSHVNDLCACWKIRDSTDLDFKKDESQGWECHRKNFTETEVEDGPQIDHSECLIQALGVMEVMGEASAAKWLRQLQPMSVNSGLILDIDEDFFGCWSDMFPLQQVEITEDNVVFLSDSVKDLFCAQTAKEESVVDMFYRAIINFIVTLKSRSCEIIGEFVGKKGKPCLTSVAISNYIIENIPNLIQFFKEFGNKHIFCYEDQKVIGLYLQNLMTILQDLTIPQLQSLSELGLCFQTSPSSLYFSSSPHMHICLGENTPKNTQVNFHLPSESEIKSQTASLQKIFSSLFKSPNIVTVCRSVRDGYTPKIFSAQIESAILGKVAQVFRRVDPENILFDSNLLGGKAGWKNRSMSWDQQLLGYLSLSEYREIDG